MAFTAEDIQTVQNLAEGKPAPEPTPAASQPGPSANGNAVAVPAVTPPTPTPAPGATPTAGATPSNNQPGNPPPVEDEFDYVDLEKLGFETMEELQERLDRYSELDRQVNELKEYKNGPKFPSDSAKFLYEWGLKSEGMEIAAVKQLYDVVSLDLNSLPDQQVRFEAFKLNPLNKGLTQDELRNLFIDEETVRFGNSEDTVNPQTDAQKIRAKQATIQAKEQIAKMQGDWNATRTAAPPSPAELAAKKLEYQQFVSEQIANFDGIQVKLQAQNDKGEKLEGALNYKLSSENQKRALIEALRDPAGWWDKKLEQQGIMREGQEVPDFLKFADLVTWIDHKDELLNKSYQQGREDHKADLLKTARNIGDPGSVAGTPPPSDAKVSEAKEANRAAMKAAGYNV